MNPENFTTLIEMLAFHAENSAEKFAFTFNGQGVSFAKLWEDINRFGAFLLDKNLMHGDRVVVALPNSAEFFSAFYGIQRAGGIAVPVFPEAGAERIFSLVNLCEAKIIVAPSNLPAEKLAYFRKLAKKRNILLFTVENSINTSPDVDFSKIYPDDISFLQYTSGSTGNPKGVILTHANLLTNIRQMIAGMEITPNEIFVSWLPVYHDMGLILKTMVPFYLAAQTHLLATNLRNIKPWLNAIQNHKATYTAAPDFAYRLCLRHADPNDYDLSSLRVALNAAEPVRATTMQKFEEAFGLKNVMVAGYGLAEATVGVSMWKSQRPKRVDSRGHVSVGAPFPDVNLLIVSDEQILPPKEVGEIAIRSKANSQGYYKNPEETAKLFWKDGYFLSGDLGYLDEDGYLYIVSRKKNIIKRAGVTISPQEIEEVVDAMPKVRFSAAIGVDKGGIEGEQVVVFAEIRDGETISENELHEMAIQMVSSFYTHMGFRPARLYLLKSRSIPLTHNGKIQHIHLKEKYLSGNLQEDGAILYP
ncbi:MAG: fatty acyl-AMP ligase [Chloroflexi bacterium]|nr:fatty acyl-AMP ligase [Chloroflexota bacterium]